MCGIVGIASNKAVSNKELLNIQRDSLLHRGPDDYGCWWSENGCVGLAHRRLSIIDVSPGGHQPMQNKTGKAWIVFNGEIYNYRELKIELTQLGHQFVTESDTEVLLAAYDQWQTNCVKHLNGIFAFAIYNIAERLLFIGRDRAGEKPLFYSYDSHKLVFASELKAIMSDPDFKRQINPEALDCYLSFGFVPGDRCILKNVSKLPPAHCLIYKIDTGQLKTWQYWSLPDYIPITNVDNSVENLVTEFEILLEDSITKQMVADVPVGILLSGGVDSSLITALAVRKSTNVNTFTIRFPGFGDYDETDHARLIAEHFSTNHTELEAEETTVELLPQLARQFDEPISDSSMIPTFLVSRLVKKHCTVALGGDGGDELFGGYLHYDQLLRLNQTFGKIPLWLRELITKCSNLLPVGFKGKNWLQGLGTDLKSGLPITNLSFDRLSRAQLLKHTHLPLSAEVIRDGRIPGDTSLIQRATRNDFLNYLPEDILVKVDRASMLNSLELRAPFLDYRVIEFAFRKVPEHLKTTTADRKILLKQLCQKILPPEFNHNRKQGFSIPLHRWLRKGPWHDFFADILSSNNYLPYNKTSVKRLLRGQETGRSNSERLFSLVMLKLWCQTYQIAL